MVKGFILNLVDTFPASMYKIIIFIVLFFVWNETFSQNLAGSEWKCSQVLGFNLLSKKEITLYKIDSMVQNALSRSGIKIYFGKDSIFHSSYSAFCGNDCFPSSQGTFKQIDEKHISFFIHRIARDGDCEPLDSIIDAPFGLYYIDKSDTDKITLYVSNGDAKQDSLNLVYESIIKTNVTHNELSSATYYPKNKGEELQRLNEYLDCDASITNYTVMYIKQVENSFFIYVVKDNATSKLYLILNRRNIPNSYTYTLMEVD